MYRRVVLLLAGLVALASGALGDEYVLFWSTTGISDPNLVFSTALTNFQPAFEAPTPVPTDPNGMQVLPAGSYDLFLWGIFPPNTEDYQIIGLDMHWAGDATHTDNVAYRQRWGGPASAKRWDAGQGIALDGVMAAVTSSGIFNNLSVPNLIEADGRFLIGAAHITGALGQQAILDGDIVVAPYDLGEDPWPPNYIVPAVITFVPEPVALVISTIGGLLVRARGGVSTRSREHAN